MRVTKKNIKQKLLENDILNDDEVEYVQEKIEPKYENNCQLCRVNVLMYLGVSPKTAFMTQDRFIGGVAK